MKLVNYNGYTISTKEKFGAYRGGIAKGEDLTPADTYRNYVTSVGIIDPDEEAVIKAAKAQIDKF
jgi:hypothetical protein